MRIQSIRLLTKDTEKLKSFYADLLGLPILNNSATEFTVSAGESCLTFEQAEDAGDSPFYHFAFDIPANQIDESIQWLGSKQISLNLLPTHAYQNYSSTWDATSIYFDDPSGNVVEFIGRHSLKNDEESAFTNRSLLNISEIGLVVHDVQTTVEYLNNNLRLGRYKDSNRSFAAVGDENGLFILSARNRVWLGSQKQAEIFKTEVTIEGTEKGTVNLGSYPYTIIVI